MAPWHLLLDIEGTTTPIAFVTEVLFPYARRHVRAHLESHADDAEYRELVAALREEHRRDERSRSDSPPPWREGSVSEWMDAAVRYVEWLMDRDRKSTPLKALQGRIWETGYRRGEILAQVFDDVPEALAEWQQRGLQASIFSSGSVLAQQLLFRHTTAGDLTGFISAYFDTTVGPKTAPESYARIAAALGIPPEALLFVSDVTRELDAARAAAARTRLAMRPGNAPSPAGHGHDTIQRLTELAELPGLPPSEEAGDES